MNERKTESIVRSLLTQAGYYTDNTIIVEEQKSDYQLIDKLLRAASKKGKWRGYPEFIIRSKKHSDLLIVIECKAATKNHESDSHGKYADFAVDGALLYASFLSKEYDVLAIGISGQTVNELRISHYLYLNGSQKYYAYFGSDILPFDNYRQGYLSSDIKFNQDYGKLLVYTKELNETLHSKKIKEAQRSLLISGILIALENDGFKSSFTSHQKSPQLLNSIVSTIVDQFSNADLPEDKIKNLKQAFSFIKTHTTLNSDKEFVLSLIKEIDERINGFMRTYQYFDTIGQFYIEFLRYANNDKGLGIVLTPPHITDLFVEIAGVDKDSVVYDNCCGTGGFLISAMRRMIMDAGSKRSKIEHIKNRQLVGIEYQDDIYALSVSNMIVHGDGKNNIKLGDCFNLGHSIKAEYSPNIGLLNPPYKVKLNDIEELEFVLDNLETLVRGGTCIAIVPLSCAIAISGDVLELKKRILRDHTLEAVMSLSEDLFHNSKVNVVTCALVITAHIPHKKGKKVWLGYWRDDGFVKTKGQGRIDLNNQWDVKKQNWVNSYINREIVNEISVSENLVPEQEWCAEAFLVTDYAKITKDVFLSHVKQYLTYRLMFGLLDLEVEEAHKDGNKKSSNELIPLRSIFEVKNGLASSQVEVKDNFDLELDVRYVRPSQTYTGSIAGYVDSITIDDRHIHAPDTIYVSTDGQGSHTYSYVSSFEFVPNSNVSVLIPRKTMTLQEKLYYSLCITSNRYKFSYGRKPKGGRLKDILIPKHPPSFVYDNIFSSIFEEWRRIIR